MTPPRATAPIALRRARSGDGAAIAAVHVASWRATYAGILPDNYLARMSVIRHMRNYEAAIRTGVLIHLATGPAMSGLGGPVVGFACAGRARGRFAARLAEGEIETLYVLDDWRDRGAGRALMGAAAAQLAEAGCAGAFVWVLRDNPSRWFYARLGGRAAAESTITVGGRTVVQTAYVWERIEALLAATA